MLYPVNQGRPSCTKSDIAKFLHTYCYLSHFSCKIADSWGLKIESSPFIATEATVSNRYLLIFLLCLPQLLWAQKKHVFLGVDGLSLEYFTYAKQELGLFKRFQAPAQLIAPYPSISDYSWNIITQSTRLFGAAGRTKTFEHSHYDRERNRVVHDQREYMRRHGEPQHYFMGAFDYFLNPYIRIMTYFPSKNLPQLELDTAFNGIKGSGNQEVVSAMIVLIDSLAHTSSELLSSLVALDRGIEDIFDYYTQRGVELSITMLSDHGQTKNFSIGQPAKPLAKVDIVEFSHQNGFSVVNALNQDHDVTIPITALASYFAVDFKNLKKISTYISKLQTAPWFDNAVLLEDRQENQYHIRIYNSQGSATLTAKLLASYPHRFQYIYSPLDANPLGIDAKFFHRKLNDNDSLNISPQFPDALFRIALTMTGHEVDRPDLLVSLKDGYRVGGYLDHFVEIFRTHGSLSRSASSGLLVHTNIDFAQKAIRGQDVLQLINIELGDLYQRGVGILSPQLTDTSLPPEPSTLSKVREDLEHRQIFGLMNQAVNISQYYYDTHFLNFIFHESKKFKTSNYDFSNINAISKLISRFNVENFKSNPILNFEDIALVMDLIIEYQDIAAVRSDHRFQKLQEKITAALKDADISLEGDLTLNNPQFKTAALIGKKSLMKAYGTPFFLEETATLFISANYPRELRYEDFKLHYQQALDHPIDHQDSVALVFQEIFQEQKLQQKIYPQQFSWAYPPKKMAPESEMTLVFVPGIYDELFDREIFNRGLDQLKNQLGLRILKVPLPSACSSRINGPAIIEFIQSDQKMRKERHLDPQKYFILGYSKGAIDALHGFVKNPDFVRQHILGLLAIASPLKGTPLLNKSDLPIEIIQLLTLQPIPEVCQKTEYASKTLTPDQVQRFFQKNNKVLHSLTRYFSISFESAAEDSHLWMRMTKAIAQFKRPNDGIVTVEDSKFPPEFMATDLGTIKADHLAGITASHFPQSAFIQALYISLQYLQAFDSTYRRAWLDKVRYASSHTTFDEYKKILSNKLQLPQPLDQLSPAQLAKRIRKDLDETPYKTIKFTIFKNNNHFTFSYRKPKHKGITSLTRLPKFKQVTTYQQLIELILSSLQASGQNKSIDHSKKPLLSYPVSQRIPLQLPANNLNYYVDFRLSLWKIHSYLKGKTVKPMRKIHYPNGIPIVFDHHRVVDFRTEYQFNYQNRSSPLADENSRSGWSTILTEDNELMARLSSNSSNVALTSFSIRFSPKEFPRIHLDYQVNDDITGADVTFNGSGKDDSAFQLWIVLRVLNEHSKDNAFSKDEQWLLFAYYFGDEIPENHKPPTIGSIVENYFSNKNYIIAKIPPSKQLLLAQGEQSKGVRQKVSRNMLKDIQQAFPQYSQQELQVIGITIQHDSNNTKDNSEALFKSVKFD